MSRRHHFVTQGFLRGFAADPGRSSVWVYDKRPGRRPACRAIKSIAWQENYYSQERPDGSLDDSVERVFATGIDDKAPKLIQRLNPRPGDRVNLNTDDCALIALFVALSLTRVPSFRDGWDEVHARLGKTSPSGSLRPMVATAKQIAHSMAPKSWQFYVAPETVPLATSDNPVIFDLTFAGLPQTVGPAHPGAEVVMNLRSDLALVFSPRDLSTHLLTYALSAFDARKFTRGVVRAARHRVFYNRRSDSFDAFVKKYPDEGQRLRGD